MSGRGGRGRGRGRTPPSGARLLLQRSAEEAGLDAANLRGLQDITKPRLFPDFEWHSSGRIGHDQQALNTGGPGGGGGGGILPSSTTPVTSSSAQHQQQQSATPSKRAKDSMVYLINKSRGIQQWFQESPYYVQPSQEVDVVRYNKRPRPLESDAHVAAYVGMMADSRFFPTELLPNRRASKSRTLNEEGGIGEDGIPRKPQTLEELAAEEQQKKNASKTNTGEDGEDQEGELSDTQDLEDDDEDEVADYMRDYYASDNESDGSGGDEAVF